MLSGRSLEGRGDPAPRGMVAAPEVTSKGNRTRLMDNLALFCIYVTLGFFEDISYNEVRMEECV